MTQTKPAPSSADSTAVISGPSHALLPRVLGPFDAIMIVVGGIIGSGIFLKVSRIDTAVPSFSLIMAVWIVGGIVTLCGALALAELAAMLPHAGGPYVYLRAAFGRPAAFLWGWTEFSIVRTGSLGSLACGTVIYFNQFLISLKQQGYAPEWLALRLGNDLEHPGMSHFSQALLAIAAVLFLSWVNIIGTRSSAWMQNVTTIVKVSFLGLIILGPWLAGSAARITPAPMVWPSDPNFNFFKMIGLAMIAVYWPYDGWINIGPIAEEVKKPQRNVPLALGIGVLVVTLIYVCANLSYHSVLSIGQVQKSSAVASELFNTLGDREPESWMNWKWLSILASLGVMVSTFGALNSNLLAGPRIYFSMARDGLFPRALAQVHPRFQTPTNAILAQTVWSLLQIIVVFCVTRTPKDAFDTLTDFVIQGGTIFYALTVAAVYVLRRKMPVADRPYRTWGYPVTPAVYLIAAAVVVYSGFTDPESGRYQILAVVSLMAVGLLIYAFFRSLEIGEVERAIRRKAKRRKK
ncbi:MAG: amino acid permease [Planctomycetales bacterium]|nr:amino acid permease [Planctomycetales bacterium]